MANSKTSDGPLGGLRVIELGQLIAGPSCGQLLGDLGADVVKIEPPGRGDPMRQWGREGYPLYWEILGRNKRTVSADLKRVEGQALARRLIADADVLIENFRPGTLERWNLAPDDLQAHNPGLIVMRVSGYGQTGPYADRTGFGGIGEAMGGWRHIVGDADRPPSRMGVSIGDMLAGMFGCIGVLAALRHRDRPDGHGVPAQGQVIDSSLFEAVLHVMESLVPDFVIGGFIRERSGAILPGVAPSNVYPCRDGDYLIAANQDRVFGRLCEAMGRPELASDPRFVDHEQRGCHQVELDRLIGEWTRGFTVAELEAAMIDAAVPAGKIYRAPEMIADPHFQARQSIVEIDHPKWGRLPMQNVFPKFSATPGSIRRHASQCVGQDNAEIYGQRLGIGNAELAALEKAGII